MSVKPTPTIRSSLNWLAAICLVPAIIAGVVLLSQNYRQQRAELVRNSLADARTLMSAVDRELQTAETALAVLATSPLLETKALSDFRAQAKLVLKSSFLTGIVLVDSSGQQLVNTSAAEAEPLPKTNFMSLVERVARSGQPEVADLGVGAFLKTPVTSLAVPVAAQPGRTGWVLMGVVRPAHIQTIVNGFGLRPDRIVVIFDRAGVIIARSHDPQTFIGKSVAPGLGKALQTSQEGAIETASLEGVPIVSTYTRSTRSGWGAAIGIPTATLTAPLQQSIFMLAAFAALLVAMSLALARRMARRIAGAVDALRSPALALGDGKPVELPRLAIRETEEVAQALRKAWKAMSEANSALTASEMRMRGILESAMDAIITLDDAQVVVLFNASAAAMFDCPSEQAIGQTVTRFIPERFRARHFAYVARRQSRGDHELKGDLPTLAVGLRNSGEEFPLEVSYSRTTESGARFHTLIIRDVTVRVRSLEALERSNHDLQQFAYVASHDLKTPLRSISGFVQVLQKNYGDKLDEKALMLIGRTAQAARRLEQLTDDLLAYARVSADAKPFAEVDLNEVAAEIALLLDASISKTGAALTFEHLPRVLGDRTQLTQLMLNLIGNGIKYCRGRAPRVQVEAQKKGEFWEFSVRDNGIGVDAKHFERIFEVFKRLHNQNEYPGTGIGLSVCRRVVERHGGQVWLKSILDEGSTFYFTLPVLPAESSAHDDQTHR